MHLIEVWVSPDLPWEVVIFKIVELWSSLDQNSVTMMYSLVIPLIHTVNVIDFLN